ncbi:hypothetical protein Bca4012_066314 [Brassica carinata]
MGWKPDCDLVGKPSKRQESARLRHDSLENSLGGLRPCLRALCWQDRDSLSLFYSSTEAGESIGRKVLLLGMNVTSNEAGVGKKLLLMELSKKMSRATLLSKAEDGGDVGLYRVKHITEVTSACAAASWEGLLEETRTRWRALVGKTVTCILRSSP